MTSHAPAHAAISLRDISKRYGKLLAVKKLNLEVSQGEVFGFLGLNGAGKTTTIRILLDLLRPTSGTAYVLGRNCLTDGLEVRAHIGYLPGELGFYGDMTGQAMLEFLARLSQKAVDRSYRGELTERLELSSSDLRRRIREYSTGMKRKLGLVQAFQSDPPLLILDEPTEGLDPLMQEAFYQLLADVKKRGRTVFMSSHVLSEVERVCDRLAVLRQGDVVLLSEVEAVRKLAARRVRVYFAADCELQPGQLPPQHEIIEVESRRWSLRVFGPLSPLLKVLRDLPVDDLQVEEPHLEEVLKTYYREGSQ